MPEVQPAPGETDTDEDWMALMRRGEWTAAWRVCDRVLRARAGTPCLHCPRHEQYVWDGRPVEGKRVLVRCYHGLGDTVQFVRFLAPLRARAREVILWAQPPLLPLLATAAGVDRLLPLHDGTPDADYDVDLEIMELAHLFRPTPATLPRTVPYLHPRRTQAECHLLSDKSSEVRATPCHLLSDKARAPRVGECHLIGDIGDRPRIRVGVVWASGGWDPRRSLRADLLAPVVAVAGVEWYALQQGNALGDWRREWGAVASTTDVVALARRMQTLDLVISVDSFPAHLAGALGVRTWTLLQADADWRWMQGRSDNPWYPTMRLFRQPRAGDWAAAIEEVAQALRHEVAWRSG